MVLACGQGERRRYGECNRTLVDEPAVELRKAKVVADRKAEPAKRGSRDARVVAWFDRFRLEQLGAVGKIDVEEVTFMIESRRSRFSRW